jgi:hypothetical protein
MVLRAARSAPDTDQVAHFGRHLCGGRLHLPGEATSHPRAHIARISLPLLMRVPSWQVGIEDMTGSYDFARTGRFAACGMFLVGPVMHNWFGLLARVYPASMGQAKSTICKVATDQMVMAPLFNPLFVSALFTMEGRPDQIVPTLRYYRYYPPTPSLAAISTRADCPFPTLSLSLSLSGVVPPGHSSRRAGLFAALCHHHLLPRPASHFMLCCVAAELST